MKHLRLALVFALALVPVVALAQEQGFVPLTNIQNLKFAGNQGTSLPDFLNSVYMICIGLAAVIGVLQIMRAGVTWMTAAGSHEAIGNAKNLISQTIIGLILVLAPTIVFSIINPDILKLQIRGLSDLTTENPDPFSNEANAAKTLWKDSTSDRATAKARCDRDKGTTVYSCADKTAQKTRTVPATEVCGVNEDSITFCQVTTETDIGRCPDYVRVEGPFPKTATCNAEQGFVQLNAKECFNKDDGIYCGSKYSIEKPPKAPGCSVAYGNKADLKFDQTAELCCNKQDAEGIQCEAQKQSGGGMTQGLYCSCSYAK